MPAPPAPPEGSRGRIRLVVEVLVAVVIVVVLIRRLSPGRDDDRRAAVPAPDPGRPVTPSAPPAISFGDNVGTGVIEEHDGWRVITAPGRDPTAEERERAAAKARQALADYRKFAVYPPHSRPADGSQQHLIDWNPPRKIGQAFALDDKQRPISAELVLDRMFAGPGEAITAVVTAWSGEYGDSDRRPVPFQASAQIAISGGDPPLATVSFGFERAPGGPANQKQVTFVPSAIPELAAAPEQVTFMGTVVAGGREFPFNLPFRYTAAWPLIVSGKRAERIAGGSLEVDLAVDVRTESGVRVQCVLFDQDGKTPIAVFDRAFPGLQPGEQVLTLSFFGRAIRERGIDGPYSIRALHGVATFDDQSGAIRDVFWRHDQVIPTNRYRATDFSDAEWESDEEAATIKNYEGLIRELEGR